MRKEIKQFYNETSIALYSYFWST